VKPLLMAVTLTVAMLFTPSLTRACSCSCEPYGDGGPQAMARYSAAVFVGVVIDVRGPTDAESRKGYFGVAVTFRVERYWKGVKKQQITVHTRLWCCNPQLDEGKKYLVYAVGKKLETVCTRTRPIADADEDLRALGAGRFFTQANTGTSKPSSD
jgi:hypothetical protein